MKLVVGHVYRDPGIVFPDVILRIKHLRARTITFERLDLRGKVMYERHWARTPDFEKRLVKYVPEKGKK